MGRELVIGILGVRPLAAIRVLLPSAFGDRERASIDRGNADGPQEEAVVPTARHTDRFEQEGEGCYTRGVRLLMILVALLVILSMLLQMSQWLGLPWRPERISPPDWWRLEERANDRSPAGVAGLDWVTANHLRLAIGSPATIHGRGHPS